MFDLYMYVWLNIFDLLLCIWLNIFDIYVYKWLNLIDLLLCIWRGGWGGGTPSTDGGGVYIKKEPVPLSTHITNLP